MLRYKDYKLIKPDQDQVKMINELIENQNGSIFHEVALNKIVENTFQTELFYLVDNPENITSFSPVHITKNKYGLKRYHFKPLYDIPYAGFVGEKEIDFRNFKLGFFESLKYEGYPYGKVNAKTSGGIILGETSMVDLSVDIDDIFSNSINSKRRNMIRKAIKEGVTIKTYQNLDGFLEFYKVLELLHQKLGFSSKMNKTYYKEIFTSYNEKKQAFILLAYKENQLLSGVFILGNKNYMHYYKGASVYGVRNEGQGELLQWEAIKLCKEIGAEYYDLCALNKEKLPAIYSFKTGISKNIKKYPTLTNNKPGYKIANRITNLF